MRREKRSLFSRNVFLLPLVLVLAVLGFAPKAGAQDQPSGSAPRGSYLALGDSIPLGYNPFEAALFQADPNISLPLTTPLPDLLLSLSNYPQDVAEALNLNLTNASCPGQTTDSFLALVPPSLDNGCELWRSLNLPLFVPYTDMPWLTQAEIATSFLASHRDTRLVTLTIGGNDLLVLEQTCLESPSCIEAGVPGLVLTLTQNLRTIYQAIRNTGYNGPIVATTYPSLNYNDPAETALISAVNSAVVSVNKSFGGKIADVFTAFKIASGPAGLPCGVGLSFFPYPAAPGCDVHSTPAGQYATGQLVIKALQSSSQDQGNQE